jgi:hypothetical protein
MGNEKIGTTAANIEARTTTFNPVDIVAVTWVYYVCQHELPLQLHINRLLWLLGTPLSASAARSQGRKQRVAGGVQIARVMFLQDSIMIDARSR